MKKILALALCVVLAVALFASCDKGKNKNNNSRWNEYAYSLDDLGLTENPVATITMDDGSVILVELSFNDAPNTCLNFISLANSGFYDGCTFHRIISGFIVQGGDPQGNGTGNPGYNIVGEFTSNKYKNTLSNKRGTIAMGRKVGSNDSDPTYFDTAGCQFYFNLSDNDSLDGKYAVFGTVKEGMDVIDRIATVPVNETKNPLEPVVIRSITVDTEGVKLPGPDTLALK